MLAVRNCGCALRLHSCLLQNYGITCNKVLRVMHADTAVVVCKGNMQDSLAVLPYSSRLFREARCTLLHALQVLPGSAITMVGLSLLSLPWM